MLSKWNWVQIGLKSKLRLQVFSKNSVPGHVVTYQLPNILEWVIKFMLYNAHSKNLFHMHMKTQNV